MRQPGANFFAQPCKTESLFYFWFYFLLQINPLFDTDLDQWMFVGELRRSIYVSPLGDYDFDGIDCQEFMVGREK